MIATPEYLPLSELMLQRGGSTDPSKYPNKDFILYSIPAYDAGTPEVLSGSQIGSAKKNVQTGDVLLSRIVPHIRRSWIVAEHTNNDLIASGEWIVFRDTRFDAAYLKHFLLSDPFHGQFMQTVAGVGGSLLRARPDYVGRIEIPLPPLDEQKRIAAILDKADQLRQKRRQAITLLDSLTQSIFLEMFGDPVSNPKGWPEKTMSALTTSRLGKMLDQKKMHGLSTYPYLANLNVQWNRLVLDDLRRMGFSAAEKEEFALNYGDLLICEGGEIGRCAIWRNELSDCYYQKALHRVRCDLELCVPEYLLWFFWFMAKNGGLKVHTSTATIAHLTGAKLKSLMVPTPPIELQKKFSRIFCFIETKTHVAKLASEAVESLFSSLQHRAFSGQL